MLIGGMQKLSLLDYPGKTCCTVFTVGCNYRCPYCHNPALIGHLPAPQTLAEEDVLAFLQKRRGLLDGVCVTGGEALLQPGLERFLEKVKALGFDIKLDTNGSFPGRLRDLIESGLIDSVAMDVKGAPGQYARVAGLSRCDLGPIGESIALLLSDAVAYEFRTTVVRELHTSDDLLEIARWLKGARRYFLQGFVDSGDVLTPGLSGYSPREMEEFLALIRPIVPAAELRGVEDAAHIV